MMYGLFVKDKHGEWEKKDETPTPSRRKAVVVFEKNWPLRPHLTQESVVVHIADGIEGREVVNVVDQGLYGRWAVRAC